MSVLLKYIFHLHSHSSLSCSIAEYTFLFNLIFIALHNLDCINGIKREIEKEIETESTRCGEYDTLKMLMTIKTVTSKRKKKRSFSGSNQLQANKKRRNWFEHNFLLLSWMHTSPSDR